VVSWSEFLATDPEVLGSILWHYKKKIVVVLERGPLSLVSTTEELLGRNSSREYGRRIRHADHVVPSIRKKLALTSLTSGGHSVVIVRLRTKATELFLITASWVLHWTRRISFLNCLNSLLNNEISCLSWCTFNETADYWATVCYADSSTCVTTLTGSHVEEIGPAIKYKLP
jgi:hypothetical protein